MKETILPIVLLLCLSLVASLLAPLTVSAQTEFRFPRPEFSSGYQHEEMYLPAARLTLPWLDLFLLVFLLGVTAWAVLRRRSRNWVLSLSLVSLVYFGFYRQGCVCSVGSVQNVLNAFIGTGEVLTLTVALFFLIPLVTALYFGRIFCASVCPLGAAQEFCAVHPVQVPHAVDTALGMLAYAYLGITVLGIWTGCGFLICRYDPFVGFFRQGGSFNMLLAGGILLASGIFIARPYCRYLCPYGVLLRWASIFARRHASITPAECIQCRLCENACPYNAIIPPAPEQEPEPRSVGMRRLAWLLAAAPVLILVSAIIGWTVHPLLSRLHPTVRLAERIAAEEAGTVAGTTIETDAFREGDQTVPSLYAEAHTINRRFKPAGAALGAFLGLALCARLYRLSVLRHEHDYTADKGACLSCARCFKYCPVEENNGQA
ncbi:MAG: putative electron transport protein YccM [Candidatus Hydrogenedentes bacterium ADurb.Bin179]|nr:MAG: putative electron transport protein YccM [Candidatus Hydrogenedentes bacterium ADurb.Bin179]